MIGTGAVLDPALGLLLALGQVPADVPEGFAAVATLRNAGVSRKRRLLMVAGFVRSHPSRRRPWLLGTARRPRGRDPVSALAHGRALAAVVVEEIVTEAHKGDTSRLEPVFLTAGCALFAAISVYLGE